MLVPLLLLLDDQPTPPTPTPPGIEIHGSSGGGGGKDFWYDLKDPRFGIGGKKENFSRPFHYAQNNPKSEEDIAKKLRGIRERVRTVEKVVTKNIYVAVAQKQLASLVDRKVNNGGKLLIGAGVLVGFCFLVGRK